MRRILLRVAAAASGVLVGAAYLDAAAFASADAARQLTRALDASGLTAIAAEDPAAPGTFVAALYIPGSQLLVVSARHPSIDAIRYRLEMKQFREVYLDLQGSPTPAGKFFIHDAAADGILTARPDNRAVDILYEDGARQTLFNGDPQAQHLSEREYDARVATADARYARVLALLTSAVDTAPAK